MRSATPIVLGLLLILSGCAADSDPKSSPSTGATVGTADVSDNSTGDGGSITGKVVDDEQLAISGAKVGLMTLDTELTTAADGSFEFTDVPAGSHNVIVNKLGYEDIAKKVEVVAGESTPLTIILKPVKVDESYVYVVPHTAQYHAAATQFSSWALQLATGDSSAACSGCTWTIKDRAVPDFLHVEIFGKHSYANPTGDKEYFWMLINDINGAQVGGEAGEFVGMLPLKGTYTKEQLGAQNKQWLAQILCDTEWVCVEEKRDIWLSYFYGYEEVPEGYTAGPVS